LTLTEFKNDITVLSVLKIVLKVANMFVLHGSVNFNLSLEL
jgi:hypothetical protein